MSLITEKSHIYRPFTAASTRFHGAHAQGLLEHSLNVYDCLKDYLSRPRVKECYHMDYNEETIAIVALLHDICKINCYKESTRNQKVNGQWVQVPYYEYDDRLPYGHGEKSVYIITAVVVYCGTFTAGGLKVEVKDGKLHILQEGRIKKFKQEVEQITFSADFATETGQKVLYVTERAVFELLDGKLTLTEIAPGVDLEKDVLGQMEFKPAVADNLKTMDERLFRDELIGLKA